ncbi:hypothetical protein ACFSJQ_22015 [Vibrio olivae]
MKLEFLSNLVKNSTDLDGSVALILNQDTTVLASTSPAIETGKKATDYSWFSSAANQAVAGEAVVTEYQLNGVDKILFADRIQVADKQWYLC